MGRAEYIHDDDTAISTSDFKQSSNQSKFIVVFLTKNFFHNRNINIQSSFSAGNTPCFLGLEHLNKTQRRSRFNYLEKAIKIYN